MSAAAKPKVPWHYVKWPRAIAWGLGVAFLSMAFRGPAGAIDFFGSLFLGWPMAGYRLLQRNADLVLLGIVGLGLALLVLQFAFMVATHRRGEEWPWRRTVALVLLPCLLLAVATCAVVIARHARLIGNFEEYRWQEGKDHYDP